MVIPLPAWLPARAAPRNDRDLDLRDTRRARCPGSRIPGAKRPTRELSGGPPVCAPLFGLAPCGVCRAAPVTRGAGGLLPHRFTLTATAGEPDVAAVCFLWHFPSRHRDWVLPSAMPCGVRTFLSPDRSGQRPSVSLRPAAILADGSEAAQATRRPKRSLCEAPRPRQPPGARHFTPGLLHPVHQKHPASGSIQRRLRRAFTRPGKVVGVKRRGGPRRALRSPGPPRPSDRAPPRGHSAVGGSEARRRGGSRSEPDPCPAAAGRRAS